MIDPSYGFTKNLGVVPFEDALDKVKAALKTQGFGVITTIDVKATMKEKLGAEFREYQILGACNPPIAHKALSADMGIGLLLPCNVVVYKDDDDSVVVSFAKPTSMFQIVGNPAMAEMAGLVDALIENAFKAL
jgi:uncharacterized protein (DUF302 family)